MSETDEFIFKPFFEGGWVSTEYAATNLLFPDRSEIKGLEEEMD